MKMSAEDKLRYEINYCGGCEVCRDLLGASCLVLPELFRLYDNEKETGERISTDELRELVDLCNFCAICPCMNLRQALLEAKTEFVERYGLSFKIRAIENVDRVGRLGGMFPALSNFVLQNGMTRVWIEKILGLHRARMFPKIPEENFVKWFNDHNGEARAVGGKKRKVAYFTGCTAKYFFPEVGRSFLEIFERNGIEVHCPEQTCCGMPAFLEGDGKLTMECVQYNLPRLLEAVDEGHDIVCSCPTCGYMLKSILRAGAYYSDEFKTTLAVSKEGFAKIPRGGPMLSSVDNRIQPIWAELLPFLKDDGYFSSLKAADRIKVAENTYDAGEYLRKLLREDELNMHFGPVSARVAYYPPCHMREQKMGKPYHELLGLIPGMSLDGIDEIYCCGNAGIMGFKEYFHPLSIKIASRLIARLKKMDPELIATDCLSCRLQFHQVTPYRVLHPLEVIRESYAKYQEQP
jgi:glycerol-3-phosphate dehydrogenase subunit C